MARKTSKKKSNGGRTAAPKAKTVTLPKARANETYKGIIVRDGKPHHHVFEIACTERATWERAKEIATRLGGSLADQHEGALLRASDDLKKTGWFWLDKEYGGAGCAWYQGFSNGNQYYVHKGNEGLVRVVRRELIR